jgi:hypothetical protein
MLRSIKTSLAATMAHHQVTDDQLYLERVIELSHVHYYYFIVCPFSSIYF